MSTVDTRNFLGENQPPRTPPDHMAQEERTAQVVAGGSLAEALCGLGTIVLAILALAAVFTTYLAPIATLVLGAALFLEGAAVAIRFSQMMNYEVQGGTVENELELGGGMSAQVGGGIAVFVLGILALIGVVPHVLTAIAIIAAGASVLIGCGSTARLNHLIIGRWGLSQGGRSVARAGVTSAAGAQVLAGLAGIVLGILALIDRFAAYTWELSSVGLLCLGAVVLLGGLAISARMMSLLHR
jgi:hypothetical protein